MLAHIAAQFSLLLLNARSKWPHVELFARQDGYKVLFDLIRQSLNWRYPDIAQFGLEIVWMTSMVPHRHPPLLLS